MQEIRKIGRSRETQFVYDVNYFFRVLMRVYLRLFLHDRVKRNQWLNRIWVDPAVLPALIPKRIQYFYRLKMWEDIIMSEDWERRVSDTLKTIRGNLFIDIGANTGLYSLLLGENFERVIAIEPEPRAYQRLLRNKPANCSVIQVAVSDSIGTAKFYTSTFGSDDIWFGGSLLPPRKTKESRANPKEEIEVQERRLSDIVPNKIVDLVKVDVEGAEWRVLKGAEPIMNNIQRWLIELHDMRRKQELVSYMATHGYRYKWIDRNHVYFTRLARGTLEA